MTMTGPTSATPRAHAAKLGTGRAGAPSPSSRSLRRTRSSAAHPHTAAKRIISSPSVSKAR